MYLFNENLILTKYQDTTDIIIEFYNIRILYYQKRREYIIKKLKNELVILESKKRFIEEYISGKLDINKKSKEYITELLKTHEYFQDENSYDYLLNMPIYSMTLERIQKLENQCIEKRKELKYYTSKTPNQLWIIDLNELLSKLT
jgi:DNA topoisomerase-2